LTTDEKVPDGYAYEPSTSAFVNHLGKVFSRKIIDADGDETTSAAIWIEERHVNTWSLAHGSFLAGMAEIGCATCAYVRGGPPVVAIEMSMQFIGAPKLGELLEVHGRITRRTRSLVFTQCRAEGNGKLVFTATAVQKVLDAQG